MNCTLLLLVLFQLNSVHCSNDASYIFSFIRVATPVASTPLKETQEESPFACVATCLEEPQCSCLEYEGTSRRCRMFNVSAATLPDSPTGSILFGYPSEVDLGTKQKHVQISHVTAGYTKATTRVASTVFSKTYDVSATRATFYGTIGGPLVSSCARTFYFRFDGLDCTSPENDEEHGLIYAHPNPVRYYPHVVEAMCYGLPKGNVHVEFFSGELSIRSPCNTTVAYEYNSHILIEEVVPRPSNVPHVDHFMQSGGNYFHVIDVWSNDFQKRRNDSWLMILWNVNMGPTNQDTCLRFFITVNGQECASPSPLEAIFYRNNNVNLNSQHNGVVGGIRKDIPAGKVALSASWGECPGTNLTLSGFGISWFQEDNMFVEEIYPHVLTPSQFDSSYNIHPHYWTGDTRQVTGTVTSLTFNKFFSSSVLRLRLLSNLGSTYTHAGYIGSTWCFEIDRQHCSNPGPMCTAYVTGNYLSKDVIPFELMGICRGTGRGPRLLV